MVHTMGTSPGYILPSWLNNNKAVLFSHAVDNTFPHPTFKQSTQCQAHPDCRWVVRRGMQVAVNSAAAVPTWKNLHDSSSYIHTYIHTYIHKLRLGKVSDEVPSITESHTAHEKPGYNPPPLPLALPAYPGSYPSARFFHLCPA